VGIFILNISNSFTTDGIGRGIGNFLAYGIGMGMVITFLTMSLALAKSNVATNMRRVLPFISPVSGAMLVIAGIYLIDYGIWEYQVLVAGNVAAGNLLVDHFLEFQQATSGWIQETTTERIGLISLFGIIGALVVAWRDDLDDALARMAVGVVYVVSYLLVEIYNRGEFVFLPLLRFAVGWPARIGNWVTDPTRAGVLLEMIFVALVGWIAMRRLNRYRPQHAARLARTS
jgi:hypothetical protein